MKIKKVQRSQFYRYSKWISGLWSTRRDMRWKCVDKFSFRLLKTG